jgi:lipopolysaccharide export system permease protein
LQDGGRRNKFVQTENASNMRIISTLNLHVTRNLVTALAMTIFIATFVGLIGVVGQFLGMLSSGGTGGMSLIFVFVWLNMPKLLCFTLPIGILFATVLTFNRMSADNEITALRASGISLLQIVSPIILLAIMISGLCWWLQFDVAPSYSAKAYLMAKQKSLQDPVALLEPHKPFAMFPGYTILIGGKEGNRIEDVHIYIENKEFELVQNVTAHHGRITVDQVTQVLYLELTDAVITQLDPKDPSKVQPLYGNWKKAFQYGRSYNKRLVVPKEKYMNLKQLMTWVSLTTAEGGQLAYYKTEQFMIQVHKRAAWAISPFTFILIAIPLGLQMSRRETSAGLVGSIVIAALYYIPMALFSETMKPEHHPEYYMWGMNLGLQAMGLVMLWRKR